MITIRRSIKGTGGESKSLILLLSAVVVAFLLSLVAWVPVVSATTEVGGLITTDTTWTQANSPYVVTANVLVAEGVTLTIEPGVTVKFEEIKGLQIAGELIARGIETNPIVFTSNQAEPAPGDWVNIMFTKSSVDATYDDDGNYLTGSILQYCTVEYGGGSYSPVIKIVSSSPLIDRCNITDGAASGIGVQDGSPNIRNSTISNNSATAGWDQTGQPQEGGGIWVQGTARITGNTISSNCATASGGGIWVQGTASITGNTISGNSAQYYRGGGIYASGDITISENTISDNSVGYSYAKGGMGGGIYASQDVMVTGNTITNNAAAGNGANIYARGGGICGSATVIGNNIINNWAAYYGGGIYGGGIIRYNTVRENSDGITAYGQPAINYNNVYDNTIYDLRNTNAADTPNMDATNNWWGTLNEDTIRNNIYDFFDDATLGIVDFIPYLTSPAVPQQYELTIAGTGGGSVTTPGEGTFAYYPGIEVNLVATPASGYQFVGWTAPAGTFANPSAAETTFSMPAQDVTVTASFQPLASPMRQLPDQVAAGEEFEVTVTFVSPADGFHAVGLADAALAGWGVSVDSAWTTPPANEAHTPALEEAVYVWYGPYDAGAEFTAVYKVQVPVDALLGTYTFGGSLEYYIEPDPAASYEVTIWGDMQVEVAVAWMTGVTREVDSAVLPGVTITLYQNDEAIASTASDGNGNYLLSVPGPGDKVVASREGFRDETHPMTEPIPYTLHFVSDHGLIPDAPATSYVLACISLWKFGQTPYQLSLSRVLTVISAWKHPITEG